MDKQIKRILAHVPARTDFHIGDLVPILLMAILAVAFATGAVGR